MKSYVVFNDVTAPGRKTRTVQVRSESSDYLLGMIRWLAAWRQYVFWPEKETIWSAGCLEDVNAEIRRLMDERRVEKVSR